MLDKDCNGNPISSFPPCYAFQMNFTALAPRLIKSKSRNVHNKNRALKQLCLLLSADREVTDPDKHITHPWANFIHHRPKMSETQSVSPPGPRSDLELLAASPRLDRPLLAHRLGDGGQGGRAAGQGDTGSVINGAYPF